MFAFNTSSFLFLLLLSVSAASVSLPSSTFQCNAKDYFALMMIKRSFRSSSFFASWNKTTNCCDWHGIDCDSEAKGRVTDLTIEDIATPGIISSYVGDLDELKYLTIKRNSELSGRIPASVGNLKKLNLLTITDSPLLTGPIPKTVCNLPELTGLILFNNNLTGRLPGCLGAKITSFNLDYNRLSGPIPEGFLSSRTTNATILYFGVDRNNLTGPIPASMGDINFQQIVLSTNKFTDASVLFGEKKKALYIYLHNNELAFNFSKVVFPLTLQQFTMEHNKVYGSIPQQITKLKQLTFFDVSYNKLCGPIPASISELDKQYFAHNKCLCGAPLEPCSQGKSFC